MPSLARLDPNGSPFRPSRFRLKESHKLLSDRAPALDPGSGLKIRSCRPNHGHPIDAVMPEVPLILNREEYLQKARRDIQFGRKPVPSSDPPTGDSIRNQRDK